MCLCVCAGVLWVCAHALMGLLQLIIAIDTNTPAHTHTHSLIGECDLLFQLCGSMVYSVSSSQPSYMFATGKALQELASSDLLYVC